MNTVKSLTALVAALSMGAVAHAALPSAPMQQQATFKPANFDNQVRLSAELAKPTILANRAHRGYLKVGVTGLKRADDVQRAPLNIAIVMDKSSSMSGKKIVEARRAAMMTVNRLTERDFVSVITYDSVVNVIVPATRVRNKKAILDAIARVQPGGRTALFAGVSKGASELREFLKGERVNRVILLSDGMANVGPSSPGELAELGTTLAQEGIAVTTFGLGLGYNEDLMYKLAMASDGNHSFIENATELAKYFEYEFGDAMSVVAQNVDLHIELAPGVRPLRVLGRDAVIEGQKVMTRLNQVQAENEKYVLVEVEVPPTKAAARRQVAQVALRYDNMVTRHNQTLAHRVSLLATSVEADVKRATNDKVMGSVAEMIANEQSKLAVALRDQGKIQQARELLERNSVYLERAEKKYRSKRLRKLKEQNKASSGALDNKNWKRTRKALRDVTYDLDAQSTY